MKKKYCNTVPIWIRWDNKQGYHLKDYLTLWATIYILKKNTPVPVSGIMYDKDKLLLNVASCRPTSLGYDTDVFEKNEIFRAQKYCEDIIRNLRKHVREY